MTVSVNPDTLAIGHNATARAVALNGRGDTLTNRFIAWSSNDSAVARVSQTGSVSGASAGNARIVATIGGVTGSTAVVITSDSSANPAPPAVASVSVQLRAASLTIGATMQATVVLKDAAGNILTGPSVSWSSSNAPVATVNATSGLITAVSAGTASITATAGGISGSASLTVQTPVVTVAKVSVALASSTIYVGGTTTASATPTDSAGHALTGLAISWSSSNTAVARVDASSGAVTGVGAGSATITATCQGLTGSASVTVQLVPVATVSVSLASSSVTSGATTQATAVLKDSVGNVLTNRTIQWSSSNTAIATVNAANGLVQGVAAGTAAIIASSGSTTGQATVTVTATATPIAAKLGITTQPSASATSGQQLAQQPVIQLQDASSGAVSQSGVIITATVASGGGTLSGTATATTNTSGVATFSNLAISGSGTQSLLFSAPGLSPVTSATINLSSNALATPDILNNASFETGWDGFTNWSLSGTPTGVDRATDYAYTGTYSARRTWVPNPGGDVGSQFASPFMSAGYDHLWVRFYFRLTAPITTIMKFARFYNGGFDHAVGGFFVGSGNSIIEVGWDEENYAIVTPIGLTETQVIDGNWHSLEIEYWRNGDPSGYPSMAFWFDGNPQFLPDGTKVRYDCTNTSGTCNQSYWKGGRLYAGQRAFTGKMNVMEWLATLNGGNTTTGQVNLDRVSISSLGHIGP